MTGDLHFKLKELRKNRKITQQTIADRFGVTRGTVSNWELGRREPDLQTLEKLAEFYGVSLDYFSKKPTKDEFLEFLARANNLFANENVTQKEKDLLYEDIMRLSEMYAQQGLKNPAVVIDTNHSNSGKRPLEQVRIAKEVVNNMLVNSDLRRFVKGFLIESYIEDGAQKAEEGIYGKSITDPCLGWEKTEKLIYDLAEVL